MNNAGDKSQIFYAELEKSLSVQLTNRLLIPGAHTKDILKMYLRLYKFMLTLVNGNPGTAGIGLDVLSRLSELIILYLNRRRDVVKCVVSAILGDDVLEEEDEYQVELEFLTTSDDDGPFTQEDLNWNPPPLRPSSFINAVSSSRNAVSLLVGVFGGREKFLAQYKQMLASKLLNLNGYDCEKEIQSLELMKLKFGDFDLNDAQIMVRDVIISRRINTQIHDLVSNVEFNGLSCLILSKHYWPSNSNSIGRNQDLMNPNLLFPEILDSLMEKYKQKFIQLKPNQKLEFKKHLGLVTINVETNTNQQKEFSVSPVHVAVLSCLESDQTVTTDDIVKKLSSTYEETKKILQFWVSHSIIREIAVNTYQSV
jgi:anaphase-promoting complex subunit 2